MRIKNFLSLLSACFFAAGVFFLSSAETLRAAEKPSGASARYESQYENSLAKAFGRMDRAVYDLSDEPLKKSLRLARDAGVLYLSKSRLQHAAQILKTALDADSENPLAHLLNADVAVLLGNKAEAGRSYFEFWNTARKHKALLRELLDPEDREAVASHISGRLFIYGMGLPIEKPKDLPLLLEMRLEQPPLPVLILTYGLPVLVFAGTLFFVYRRFFNPDVSAESDRTLLLIFLVLLAGYIAWLAHQIGKVPALFGSPVKEVYGILAGGFLAVAVYRWLNQVIERIKEARDPDTIFCPKCGKSILKVALICPFCNAPVTKKGEKAKGFV